MRGQYEYKPMSSYPHMGPEDTKVWQRFVAAFPDKYDTADYDVKVGTAPAFVTRDEAGVGGDIANLYLRKIDVVAFKENHIDVIEVKPKAGFSTVGQILGYMMHWNDEHKGVGVPHAVIVAGECPLDARILADQNGVEVYIV